MERQPQAIQMMGMPTSDGDEHAAQRPVENHPQILIAEFHLFLAVGQNHAEDLHKARDRAGDQAQQC